MGLPDFLKFAARSAPDALVPVTESGGEHRSVEFDFALVDVTNVAQTSGFDKLFHLFALSNIVIKSSIIFAVDSQRERRDVARRFRQSSVVGDLDVKVGAFCTRLANGMSKAGKKKPFFLISGRGVAGEADYKILDIHRGIVSTTMFYGQPTPTFLFVSEDSDILCGTLCGPAPQNVSIATTLHDTTFRMNILRVSYVTTYVAACVDAAGSEVQPTPATPPEKSFVVAALNPPVPSSVDLDEKEHLPKSVATVEATDEVRRKKKDGPMIATGIREVLSDSDSDLEEMKRVEEKSPIDISSCSATEKGMPHTSLNTSSHQMSNSSTSGVKIVAKGISPLDLSIGWITYGSCVDLVFLFQLIMGNGDTIPPLVRGVTKIDIQSCWAAYCRRKYDDVTVSYGRQLLQMAPTSGDDLEGSMILNCTFLYYILDAVHYTDGIARPPTAEERDRAVEFLSTAASSTVRYIVGCNVQGGGGTPLVETILDSRPSSHAPLLSPSVAAMRWVLESGPSTLSFKFSLDASGKKGDNSGSGSLSTSINPSVLPTLSFFFGSHHGVSEAYDVSAHLNVVPTPLSSGSQGDRFKVLSVDAIVQRCLYPLVVEKPKKTISIGQKLVAACNDTLQTLSDLPTVYKRCSSSKVFSAIVQSWAFSIARGVSQIQSIGASSRFISPATGRMVVGPLSAENVISSGKEKGTSVKEVPMTYSFELRRMIPVVSFKETGIEKGEEDSSTGDAHTAHRLRAIGVSFGYAKEDVEHSNAFGKVERSAHRSDEPFKKKPKKELNAAAASLISKTDSNQEGEISKKKKTRLGKKERMKHRHAVH